MPLDNTKLVNFLEEMDKELERRIVIVVAGGTAMTLMGAKPTTIDVDFTVPEECYDEFMLAKSAVQPGFTVDVFYGGGSVCDQSA